MGRGNFEQGQGRPIVKYRALCGHLCKKGSTDRKAVWVVDSDGPTESCYCVRCGFRGDEGCRHGNQFSDAVCYRPNWLCV